MSERHAIPIIVLVFAGCMLASPAGAGVANVRLLQRYIEDAPDLRPGWLEAGLRLQDFDGASATIANVRGTARAGDRLEVGASFGHASIDGGADGLVDPELFVRYLFDPEVNARGHRTQIGLGAALSLPVGDEDLLQGTLDVEGFLALRHYLDTLALMGALGVRANGDPEIEVRRGGETEVITIPAETSFFLAGALLAPASDRVTFTVEIDIETERLEGGASDVRLTPGLDARAGERVHLRGGVGIGLTDGAPDLEVLAGVAIDL